LSCSLESELAKDIRSEKSKMIIPPEARDPYGGCMAMETRAQTVDQDFYRAHLENGQLAMAPFCACGNALNEDYFCERCQRKCRCELVICEDQATLDRVREYILKASQFSGFKARLP
jgi:hypothetical protein